jgi:hypothetical protein
MATINGGMGNDVLTSRAGADHFAFSSATPGTDTITDFAVFNGGGAEGNRLVFVASWSAPLPFAAKPRSAVGRTTWKRSLTVRRIGSGSTPIAMARRPSNWCGTAWLTPRTSTHPTYCAADLSRPEKQTRRLKGRRACFPRSGGQNRQRPTRHSACAWPALRLESRSPSSSRPVRSVASSGESENATASAARRGAGLTR